MMAAFRQTVGLMKPLYAASDWAQYTWLFTMFAWLIVLVILGRTRAGLGWRIREDRIRLDSMRTTGDTISTVG